MSVDFTGWSVEFTNNLWIQQKNLNITTQICCPYSSRWHLLIQQLFFLRVDKVEIEQVSPLDVRWTVWIHSTQRSVKKSRLSSRLYWITAMPLARSSYNTVQFSKINFIGYLILTEFAELVQRVFFIISQKFSKNWLWFGKKICGKAKFLLMSHVTLKEVSILEFSKDQFSL